MKRYFFLLIWIVCCPLMMMAQQAPQLPDKVKVKLPQILDGTKLPRMEEDLYPLFSSKRGSKWGQDRTVNKLWVVHSDRDNNKTYTTAEKNAECTSLSFGEEVCIADIKNDMALVYTDNRHEFPNISPHAKSKGWIPLEHLLLWSKCPTDTRGVQLKALIAINLNKTSEKNEFRKVKLKNPDEQGKSSALNMDMNFYYIMKETPDQEWALLCTGAQFSTSTLYGWVHKTAYTIWNQRTCLEPNWQPAFVANHKGNYVCVYDDPGHTVPITRWDFGHKNKDNDERFQYRMNANLLRFPVLSQVNDGMIKCTAFADHTGSANAVSGFENVTEMVKKTREQMRQMNILLAVEATSSMSEYFPAIKTALASCKDYAAQGLNVQVGLVLYRNDNSNIALQDIVPLCNYDDAQLLSKLQQNVANTRLTGESNVSLCQAIETAANSSKMGFNDKQSNLVLVIGNHGPDTANWDEQHVLDVLKKNKIQLASIQIMRSDAGSRNRYVDAISPLIRKNIETQYAELAAKAEFVLAPNGDGYIYKGYRKAGNQKGTEASNLFASARFNEKINEEMKPADLTHYINSTVSRFSKTINNSSVTLEESLADVDFYPEFLISKIGEKNYKSWKSVKAISAYAGYAKIKDLSSQDDWKSIIYLSYDELQGLIRNLEGVSNALKNRDTDRNVFVSAIRELLRRQLGGSISDKEIQELPSEKLEEAIYGIVNIPSENMRFTKYSLKDLMNRKAVNDEKYFEILDNFDKKYKKLKTYLKDYKYCMEVGNESGAKMRYYWIPLEDLP